MLDILGTLSSLLSTYYFIRLDNRAWLVSLVATCLNTWLFWQKGIYADMFLQVFYFLSSFLGLLLWRNTGARSELQVQTLSKNLWFWLILAVGTLYLVIRTLLTTYSSSTVANLDAITTALSLAAQWLMAYKIITTWLLWLLVDLVYAYLYLQKQIPFHVALVLIYSLMAVVGYCSWYRQMTKNKLWQTSCRLS